MGGGGGGPAARGPGAGVDLERVGFCILTESGESVHGVVVAWCYGQNHLFVFFTPRLFSSLFFFFAPFSSSPSSKNGVLERELG